MVEGNDSFSITIAPIATTDDVILSFALAMATLAPPTQKGSAHLWHPWNCVRI